MKTEKPKLKVDPAYRYRLKAEKANEIYIKIIEKLTREKLYRDPTYNTFRLSEDLNISTRYISAAVSVCTGNNYNALVNGLRLRDVVRMMQSDQFKEMTVEEIGLLAGFASRQTFYMAFHRVYDCTPRVYRAKLEKK